MNTSQADVPPNDSRILRVRPRYCRLYTDPGVEPAERNYRHAYLDWAVPLAQCALVCVDVWDGHHAADTCARTDAVTRTHVAPLVHACRQHGLRVIHAPASPVAQKHANWVRLVPDWQHPAPAFADSPDWPPSAFKRKEGPYAAYARPHEPQEDERAKRRETSRWFHPDVQPEGDEAVVVCGEELHRFCAQREVLFLFYVGFHTNACMIHRDYAPFAMRRRGYECVVLRDCTTGMETAETADAMTCTRGAIASFEQFGLYTMTSDELAAALAGSP